jgi:hypothetical protein
MKPRYVPLELTQAVAGSPIRVSVLDETDTPVWTTERIVEPGDSLLNFSIGEGELSRGRYRAQVTLGAATLAEREFEV